MYPAPGNRNAQAGLLGAVGKVGYGWLATSNGTNGMDLNFGTLWLSPNSADARGLGFQLRCLSE
ncbi:hypothetical protein [uncultured Rikenella sp.]|uniref:hypothetical protein n=1 Tax=uncultured Rikenella sp. TaxID=368003 RepID=UPI002613420C|nr:hypothetical protein [uncultured Rikenella sp.]